MARVEAYLHAKFHLDPFNRLATVHERYRQDRTDRTDNGPIAYRANRFTNGPPKTILDLLKAIHLGKGVR